MRKSVSSLITAIFSLILLSASYGQSIVISEFMADNVTSSERDEDGERSDWVELQNVSGAPVNLNGWYLTDDASDLRKWRFPLSSPTVTIAAGARLVVWCSGKDRKAALTRLHTNFKLDKDGEYLALVRSDGVTVEHDYGPTYPPQFINGTYGIATTYSTTIVVAETATAKYRSPADAADYTGPMTDWNKTVAFNDSGWLEGPGGFGYGDPFTSLIGTNVTSLMAANPSLCIRYKFEIPSLASVAAVRLRVKYDDGFAAFVNGTRIGGGLAPTTLEYNSPSLFNINRPDSTAFELISTPNAQASLVQGTNLLAFQLLNASAGDSNALLRPQLEIDEPTGTTEGYLTSATRGTANSAQTTVIGPVIEDVTRNPARPVGGVGSAPITVTAKVTPTLRPLAASNPVVLKWRRMYGTETSVNMVLNVGTGLYTAEIPTTSLTAGEMLRWRVEARDNGASPTYGYAPEYPFGATTPPSNPPSKPTLNTSNPYVDLDQYYGTVAADGITTSNIPVLHWFVDPAALTNPETANGEPCSFFFQPIPQFPPGTPDYVAPGPQFYDAIPVTIHGQSSGGFPQKSHNISFNKDNRFFWKDGEPELRSVNLLSTYADKTKIRHSLAWDTWNKSGHLASHFCTTVRVQRNAAFRGLYDMVEDGNEDYIQRFGLDPLGSLYKVYNSLENANPTTTNGGGSEKKNPDTTDFSDLQALVDGVGDAKSTTDRLRYVYDNVDVASLVNFLAMHTLIMNRDTGHKNYYMFRDTATTGEWSALPWDQDLSFGHTWTGLGQGYFDDDIHSGGPLQIGAAANNKLMRVVYGSPELNAMFVARVRSLANQFLVSAGETNGPLEQKINALLNEIDPNPGNPTTGTDDADFNTRQWGFWTDGSSALKQYTDPAMPDHTIRVQADRILNNNPHPPYPGANPYADFQDSSSSLPAFLPGRRAFMFNAAPPTSGTLPLPATEPSNPDLIIESITANPGTQDQEYFIIRNNSTFAVDLSGWQLTGEVEMTFRGGTVIPGTTTATLGATNSTYKNQLIVANKPLGIRQRSVSPKANEFRQVSGPYKGQLSARGGTIVLSRPNNLFDPSAGYTQVSTATYAALPTAFQTGLRISELHYAPSAPTIAESQALPGVTASDFEFIELLNTGATTLNIANASFDRGVTFVVPAGAAASMAPGARRLIVSNVAAFRVRYGTAFDSLILGEYLGNLSNGGEELQLLDPAGEVVLEFDYSDLWYPLTDGQGRSLEVISFAHTEYGEAASYRVSYGNGGSPGYEDIAPEITNQSGSQTVNPNVLVTFSVTATGTPLPSYQWRKGGEDLNGKTGATLQFNATEADEGSYDVVVTNVAGMVTSTPVTLSVNNPVEITAHPTASPVNPDVTVVLSVTATGTGTLSYQWRKNTEPILNAHNSTLEFAAEESREGSYDVIVTNVAGSVTSNAAVVSVNDPVQITSHPNSTTVNPNAIVTFSVGATGTGPIGYKWRKNGEDLPGPHTSSLQFSASEAREGSYDVVVSNVAGSVTSNPATLSVNNPVTIQSQPQPLAISLGAHATFTVVAQGTGTLNYQWRRNNEFIGAPNSPTLNIPVVTEEHIGAYDVIISNIVGAVQSAPATLRIVNWTEETGKFEGLLAGPDLNDPAADPRPGRVNVTLSKGGKLTGKLEYFGLKYSFKATLDADMFGSAPVTRKFPLTPLTVDMHYNANTDTFTFEVKHAVGAGEYVSTGEIVRIPVRAKTVPPVRMGRYTLALEAGLGTPVNVTAPGFLMVSVAKNGRVSWVGKLPDAAVVKGSAGLANNDSFAFYSPLYSSKLPYAGQIAGPMAITSIGLEPATISGDLAWGKPTQVKGFYLNGFKALVTADGAIYTPPLRGIPVVPEVTLELHLEGPITGGSDSALIQVTPDSKFLAQQPNVERISLKLNRSSGGLTGSYYDSGQGKTRKLEGVLIQTENRGIGLFPGLDSVGTWELMDDN